MKRAILHVSSFPADVVAWLVVLFMWALWGHRLGVRHGVLCCELKKDSWPMQTWYKNWGATTFGHGIIFAWDHLDYEPIWLHELTHVEQYESECMQDMVVLAMFGTVGQWSLGLVWCAFGGLIGMFAGFATAWARGEAPYTGSHFEEAARNAVSCRNKNLAA